MDHKTLLQSILGGNRAGASRAQGQSGGTGSGFFGGYSSISNPSGRQGLTSFGGSFGMGSQPARSGLASFGESRPSFGVGSQPERPGLTSFGGSFGMGSQPERPGLASFGGSRPSFGMGSQPERPSFPADPTYVYDDDQWNLDRKFDSSGRLVKPVPPNVGNQMDDDVVVVEQPRSLSRLSNLVASLKNKRAAVTVVPDKSAGSGGKAPSSLVPRDRPMPYTRPDQQDSTGNALVNRTAASGLIRTKAGSAGSSFSFQPGTGDQPVTRAEICEILNAQSVVTQKIVSTLIDHNKGLEMALQTCSGTRKPENCDYKLSTHTDDLKAFFGYSEEKEQKRLAEEAADAAARASRVGGAAAGTSDSPVLQKKTEDDMETEDDDATIEIDYASVSKAGQVSGGSTAKPVAGGSSVAQALGITTDKAAQAKKAAPAQAAGSAPVATPAKKAAPFQAAGSAPVATPAKKAAPAQAADPAQAPAPAEGAQSGKKKRSGSKREAYDRESITQELGVILKGGPPTDRGVITQEMIDADSSLIGKYVPERFMYEIQSERGEEYFAQVADDEASLAIFGGDVPYVYIYAFELTRIFESQIDFQGKMVKVARMSDPCQALLKGQSAPEMEVRPLSDQIMFRKDGSLHCLFTIDQIKAIYAQMEKHRQDDVITQDDVVKCGQDIDDLFGKCNFVSAGRGKNATPSLKAAAKKVLDDNKRLFGYTTYEIQRINSQLATRAAAETDFHPFKKVPAKGCPGFRAWKASYCGFDPSDSWDGTVDWEKYKPQPK